MYLTSAGAENRRGVVAGRRRKPRRQRRRRRVHQSVDGVPVDGFRIRFGPFDVKNYLTVDNILMLDGNEKFHKVKGSILKDNG